MRLRQVAAGSTMRFLYDGLDMVAHYDSAGALQFRYVFGDSIDEPLLQYNPSGVRTWYSADERGSIIANSNDSGALTGINKYDEFGKPQVGPGGRFQYTGQMWLNELGMYFYKTRAYAPALGRFMQADPIGYLGGMNVYAYVGNDPVNFVDPLGLVCRDADGNYVTPQTGTHTCTNDGSGHSIYPAVASTSGGFGTGELSSGYYEYVPGSSTGGNNGTPIVITAGHWTYTPGSPSVFYNAGWGGPGHNNPPLGWRDILKRGLGWISAILSMEGDTCRTCVEITFSNDHGARHLEGSGLNQQEVEAAIQNDIRSHLSTGSVWGSYHGRISINETTIVYRAHFVTNARINVGTYFIPGLRR